MIHRWLTQGKQRNDYPKVRAVVLPEGRGAGMCLGRGHTGWGLLDTGCLLYPNLSNEHTNVRWIKID